MSLLDERQILADRLVQPLTEGKPELGWSGDPDLVLTFHRIEQRWELLRHQPERGQPDRHVIVARGPVGQDLNEDAINQLIAHLVQNDTHRAGNSHAEQMEEILRHNDKVEADNANAAADATADSLAKFYTEAGKTLGVAPTFY